MPLIHPSAWKEDSANFAFTEFWEVRTVPSPSKVHQRELRAISRRVDSVAVLL